MNTITIILAALVCGLLSAPMALHGLRTLGRAGITAANSQLPRQAFTGAVLADSPVRGQLTACNASSSAHMVQPLSDYIVGIPVHSREEILQRAFPAIPNTPRRFSYRTLEDSTGMIETGDRDVRAPGAAFRPVQIAGDEAEGKLLNRGLTRTIDRDDTDDMQREIQFTAEWLKARLVGADFLRGIALLEAAATNANVIFSASTNPDGLMRTAIDAARTAGLMPTKALAGNAYWHLRLDAYEAAARANPGTSSHADYSTEQLASYLMIDDFIVDKQVGYQAKRKGASTEFLASVAYFYHAEEGLSVEDASVVKRFTGMTDAGGEYAVYVDETHPKFVAVTVECYSLLLTTLNKAIRKHTATAS